MKHRAARTRPRTRHTASQHHSGPLQIHTSRDQEQEEEEGEEEDEEEQEEDGECRSSASVPLSPPLRPVLSVPFTISLLSLSLSLSLSPLSLSLCSSVSLYTDTVSGVRELRGCPACPTGPGRGRFVVFRERSWAVTRQ